MATGVQSNTGEDQTTEKERTEQFEKNIRLTVALKHILSPSGIVLYFSLENKYLIFFALRSKTCS